MFRRLVLAAALALAPLSVNAADALAPHEAAALATKRAALLVDVRSPAEWAETGIPAGARTVSWGRPDFVQRMLELVAGDRNAPLVLICRSGNRSTKAMAALRDSGFTHVAHIPEGMAGGPNGPGWLARGLPVERVN